MILTNIRIKYDFYTSHFLEIEMNVFEVKNLNKDILKNTLKTRHDIEG